MVHAERVAHVLRYVELTEEVITSVRVTLEREGIAVDETVDDALDDAATGAVTVVTVEAEPAPPLPTVAVADGDDAKTRPRRPPRPPTTDRGEGGTSDTVRMYLKEIGRVSLLTAEDERDLAKRIEAGVQAEERRAASNGTLAEIDRAQPGRRRAATATRPGPSSSRPTSAWWCRSPSATWVGACCSSTSSRRATSA